MAIIFRISLTWFLITVFNQGAKSQTKQVTRQGLFWMRYYNQLSLNEKWTWHNEIDERRFFEKNRHQHLIIHSRLHNKLTKDFEIAFGLTYSRQNVKDPGLKPDLIVPELRPVQEIIYTHSISKRWTIQQRIRIDERFFRRHDGQALTQGWDFNFRFRYRLQANYRFNKDNTKTPVTLKIYNELMFNSGKRIVYNHFDQNRIYAGIEHGLSKKFSVELGYMYLYQQRASGYQFFNRNILRTTLYHKLKW